MKVQLLLMYALCVRQFLRHKFEWKRSCYLGRNKHTNNNKGRAFSNQNLEGIKSSFETFLSQDTVFHSMCQLWKKSLRMMFGPHKSSYLGSLANTLSLSLSKVHFLSLSNLCKCLPAVWLDWAIYWTSGNFSKLVKTISSPKSPTFLGNFCKVKGQIIFGQLL